jgi:hypothetical protein
MELTFFYEHNQKNREIIQTVNEENATKRSQFIQRYINDLKPNVFIVHPTIFPKKNLFKKWVNSLDDNFDYNFTKYTIEECEELTNYCNYLEDTHLQQKLICYLVQEKYDEYLSNKHQSVLNDNIQETLGRILIHTYAQRNIAPTRYAAQMERIQKKPMLHDDRLFFSRWANPITIIPLSQNVFTQTKGAYCALDRIQIEDTVHTIKSDLECIISLHSTHNNTLFFGKGISTDFQYDRQTTPFVLLVDPTDNRLIYRNETACPGPDNSYYCIVNNRINRVTNSNNYREIGSHPHVPEDAHITWLTGSNDGNTIAIATDNQVWSLQDTQDWKHIAIDIQSEETILGIAVSHNGTYLCVLTGEKLIQNPLNGLSIPIVKECSVYFFNDTKKNANRCTVKHEPKNCCYNAWCNVMFSADDAHIIIKSNDTCTVYNIEYDYRITKQDEAILSTCLTPEGLVFHDGSIALPTYEIYQDICNKKTLPYDSAHAKTLLQLLQQQSDTITEDLKNHTTKQPPQLHPIIAHTYKITSLCLTSIFILFIYYKGFLSNTP